MFNKIASWASPLSWVDPENLLTKSVHVGQEAAAALRECFVLMEGSMRFSRAKNKLKISGGVMMLIFYAKINIS